MDSEKNVFDAKKLLMDRYKFLYENAPFILAEIQAEHFDEYPALCHDIKSITGIDGSNLGPFNRKCSPDNITIPYTLLFVTHIVHLPIIIWITNGEIINNAEKTNKT